MPGKTADKNTLDKKTSNKKTPNKKTSNKKTPDNKTPNNKASMKKNSYKKSKVDEKVLQEVITIDAEKLTEDIFWGKVDTQPIDPSDEYCEDYIPVIDLDFSKPMACPYVKSVNTVEDNAAFFQIGKDNLYYRLVYLDFGNIFNTIDKSTFENSSEGAKKTPAYDLEKEKQAQLLAEIENEYNSSLSLMQPYYNSYDFLDFVNSHRSILKDLFKNGFRIRSAGQIMGGDLDPDTQTFLPFEKSASMGRENTISFIVKYLIEDLNKCLLLDMDISAANPNLAKFYAYKGLYFTSSKRITSKEIILNSESVIVIDDIGFRPKNKRETIDTITAIPPEKGKEGSNQSYTICNKKLLKSEALSNLFDGEGLICPEYSQIINKELSLSETTASYQVRMPFTKGMLHRVDFHQFLREFLEEKGEVKNANSIKNGSEKDKIKSYEITDAFGIKRDLMKAKIILTKSMFKCFDWYSGLFRSDLDEKAVICPEKKSGMRADTDPLAYYFEKFRKYNHALYIANTDDYYQGKNLVQLNYQFLNTLCFSEKDYDKLLETHRECISNPVKYLMNHAEIRLDDKTKAASEKWKDILLKYATEEEAYKGLYAEPVIKENLKKECESIKNKMAFGKYLVNGEIRFLSRDLLFLLYSLLNKNDQNSKKGRQIKSEFLEESVFDMPGDNCELKSGYHYAIFRNPHLSRNEQCALRFKKINENSIRYKYLSHLKGIIMLSHLSVDPMTLGGADFDGDLVKVINNDLIRDSVLKNRYDLQGEYLKGKDYFRSKSLPVIDIHAYKVDIKGEYKTTPDFDIMANTFSNSIGKLSNLSTKYGKLIYSNDAFEYFNREHSKKLKKVLNALVLSMDKNLMSLKLSKQDKEIISFGSRQYKLSDLKQMRKYRKKELNYEDLPVEYTNALKQICLENFCPSLTIYTGMDIDAPKNNIRPNIDDLFKAFSPLFRTYNFLGNFKNRIENSFNSIDHMPKAVLNENCYQLGKDSYHVQYPLSPFGSYFSIDLIPYFYFSECLNKNEHKKTTRIKKKEKLIPTKVFSKSSDNYQKAAAAVEAYAFIKKKSQTKINNLNFIIKAECLKKIDIILKAQYNNDFESKKFQGLYEEFLKFNFDLEKLKEIHRKLASSDWQFLPKESRPVELRKLLEGYIENNQHDMLDKLMKNKHIELLYNFDCKGYFLLYLMIGHAKNSIILSEPEAIFIFESPEQILNSEETEEILNPDEGDEVLNSDEGDEVLNPGEGDEVLNSGENDEVLNPDDSEEIIATEEAENSGGIDIFTKSDLYKKTYISVYNKLAASVGTAFTKLPKDKIISFSTKVEPALKKQWAMIIKDKSLKLNTDIIRAITDEKHSTLYNQIYWNSVSTKELESIIEKKAPKIEEDNDLQNTEIKTPKRKAKNNVK